MNEAALEPADRLVVLTHVMYALHALSALGGLLTPALVVTAFLTGWPSLIAIIINYVKRDEARGTWIMAHLRWQARTFWFALLWLMVAWLLALTVILLPVAWVFLALTGLWVVYRIVRGWLALLDRRPVGSYAQ
jgi:uncharacterized membrane protein